MELLLTTLTAFFGFAGKVYDKLPDWLQKKKDEFYRLEKAYYAEWTKPTSERDGRYADQVRIDLETFNSAFWRELESSAVKK